MRRMHVNVLLAGLALALPLAAFGQNALPVIPALPRAHAKSPPARVWKHGGAALSVTARGAADAAVPGAATPLEGRTRAASTGVKLTLGSGITAHADVRAQHWAPLAAHCTALDSAACLAAFPQDSLQRGEVGAGFAAHGVKLDLSLGQSQSNSSALARPAMLPRVLPAAGGADVAAPLWFRNSTATDLSARGEVSVAPGTSLDLGASVGRVRFLPGSGLPDDDTLDQTTLSFGISHGAVRGAIVGHVLEPNLPGAALDQNQRWSGIDLGISVRLPWRGELNFGAQNVWTSGRSPLLFGSGAATPDQGRVPYVQYHQDL